MQIDTTKHEVPSKPWGACCRRFKSCHPDEMIIKHLQIKK